MRTFVTAGTTPSDRIQIRPDQTLARPIALIKLAGVRRYSCYASCSALLHAEFPRHRVLLLCNCVPLPTCAIRWEIAPGAILVMVMALRQPHSHTVRIPSFRFDTHAPSPVAALRLLTLLPHHFPGTLRELLHGLRDSLVLCAEQVLQQALPLQATFGAPEASSPSPCPCYRFAPSNLAARGQHMPFSPSCLVLIVCP